MRVSAVSIVGNIILSLFKLMAGIVAHSGAMISDAVHSASDVFSSIVVIIGVKLSAKASDKEHPYGHERMECVAAVILAGILLATGLGSGLEAVKNIVIPRLSIAGGSGYFGRDCSHCFDCIQRGDVSVHALECKED